MTVETLAATTDETALESDDKSVESPGADSAPAVADTDENPNRKAKEGFSERIDELTRNRREAERERDYWREQALRSQRLPEAPREAPREQPSDDQDLKTLADFNYDERAYGKYVRHVAEQAAERKVEGLRKEFRESKTQEEKAAARDDFHDRAQSWAKTQKIEDTDLMFADPRDGGPIVTEAMADSIMDSEHGAAVLHYLAKNRELSVRISRMSPLQQAREIGRLEAKFTIAPQPNKVSGAPPPPPQISGASDVSTKKDWSKESDDAWYAAHKAKRKQG